MITKEFFDAIDCSSTSAFYGAITLSIVNYVMGKKSFGVFKYHSAGERPQKDGRYLCEFELPDGNFYKDFLDFKNGEWQFTEADEVEYLPAMFRRWFEFDETDSASLEASKQ